MDVPIHYQGKWWKCSTMRPLFSREQEERPPARLRKRRLEEETEDLEVDIDLDFDDKLFFQKLIELIVFRMDELSKDGELPAGFVQ
eukprot:scaffold24032_cov171-Cylindrotheca_fusiformis.AAC.1